MIKKWRIRYYERQIQGYTDAIKMLTRLLKDTQDLEVEAILSKGRQRMAFKRSHAIVKLDQLRSY